MAMHRSVHALMIGAAAPRRIWLLKKLQARTDWGFEKIQAYQQRKLRSMIRYCWKYVPYYRSRWSSVIRPAERITAMASRTAATALARRT